MIKKENIRYYTLAFIIVLLILSYFIIKPYISALLTSCILAYLFYPIYTKLKKWTKNETISSLIATLLIILIMLLPIVFIARALAGEAINVTKSGFIVNIKTYMVQKLGQNYLGDLASQTTNYLVNYLQQNTSEFLLSIPKILISLVIAAFTLFYLFIIGEQLVNSIKKILPTEKKDRLVKHIGDTTNAIIYGLLLTAIIHFIFAYIAFVLLKVKSAIILALIIGVLGLIPLLGPAVVWIPLSIVSYVNGNPKQSIGIAIVGIILSGTEQFMRTKLIGIKSKLHPVIILVGVIGGLELFGIIGLVIGPIILSSLAIIINEYFEIEKDE